MNKQTPKQQIDELVKKGKQALDEFLKLDQQQIDYIVKKVSVAALDNHGILAKAAIDETKRGVFEDKATKNLFSVEYIINYMRHLKTVGVIKDDPVTGIMEIAEPLGVICGITPVTNPTSTVIFKTLMCLKTRNPIIYSFHPQAFNCSAKTAKILLDAAVEAGAPKNCIQWIVDGSMEHTQLLMKHPGVATILATGGNSMVESAYSCGKPALGVGAGNVPVYFEKTCDIAQAANDVVMSKSFDNGMVCASEQAAIIDKKIYTKVIKELKSYGVYFVNKDEKKKLEKFLFNTDKVKDLNDAYLTRTVPGMSAQNIAKNAGFSVPKGTVILAAECSLVGPEEPLTREKLSPVLAILKADTTNDGIRLAKEMVNFNGLGHSAGIHSHNEEVIEEYGKAMKAIRIIVNGPTTFGGIGGIYNKITPSLTLGCGSYGKNSVGDNVNALNLINIKKIGRRKTHMQWFKIPSKIYFEPDAIEYLRQMRNVNRVFIITDRVMVDLGYVNKITEQLNQRRNMVHIQLFADVEPDPTLETVKRGHQLMKNFVPDTIIALGGGSPMDAAKVMWLYYENPDVNFDDLKQKFMDIRKRAFRYPELGKKSKLVCIPTTSGTGSEVTPFAVITDDKTNKKYPLADYSLTPTVAIVDPSLTTSLPRSVTVDTGLDVLTHAVEAYISVLANDYTDALAYHAVKMVFKYLKRAAINGKDDLVAREKMHNASTMAGMAFGNAFLGVCHAMAHKIGVEFNQIHGRTNAILLPHVIRYNGTRPPKLSTWAKYRSYIADKKLYDLALAIGLKPKNVKEGVEMFADACYDLAKSLGIDMSFKAQGVSEEDFFNKLDDVCFLAYEDQCAPANPRLAMLEDMKEIMTNAYYGKYPSNVSKK